MNARRMAARSAGVLAALITAFPVAVLIGYSRFPSGPRIEAFVVLLATVASPAAGVLLVAALAPLGDIAYPLLGAPPRHHAETIALACLAGWFATRAFNDRDRPSTSPGLRDAGFLFAAIVIASTAATCVQLYRADAHRLHDILGALRRDYLWIDDAIGVHAAANLLEGVGVMFATAWTVRRKPAYALWVPLALVGGAVVAALSTMLLARGIAPAATLARQAAFGPGRYSATVPDLNAAGSYYLLITCMVTGLAVAVRRARAPLIVAGSVTLFALWLTGSRAALLTLAVMGAGAVAVRELRLRTRVRTPIVAAALLIAAALIIGIAVLALPSLSASATMRGGFTRASLALIAARPVFGIGEGRYYTVSALVLPPPLAWAYGNENAHDYFLQLTAELGVVGAFAFGWLMLGVLRPAGGPRPLGWGGLWTGAAAFLITAVVGHPFLVPEAGFPLWIVAGLLTAAVPAPNTGSARTARISPCLVACVVLVSIPFRPGVPRLGLSPREDGFGPVRTDSSGVAYRQTNEFGSLFVERDISAVEVPLRIGEDASVSKQAVQIAVPGGQRWTIGVGREWTSVTVHRPYVDPALTRWRINIAVLGPLELPEPNLPPIAVARLKIAPTPVPGR